METTNNTKTQNTWLQIHLAIAILSIFSTCNLKEEPYDPNNIGSNATKFETSIGGNLNDFPNDVICSSDGEYVIAGYSQSFTIDGDNQAYLVKLDKQGKVRWEKNFGGTNDDYADAVVQTSDGGYMLCGRTRMSASQDILVVKLDAQGNKVWEKTYGAADSTETVFGIVNGSGGNVVIAYLADLPSGSFSQLKLLGLSSSGAKVLNKVVQNGKFSMNAIIKTSDGKLVMTGNDNGVAYVIKCGEDGAYIWEKRYPIPAKNYTQSYALVELKDKSILTAGFDQGNNKYDFNLLAFGQTGNNLWQSTWGGANDDELFDIDLSSDNQIVVMGYTNSFSGKTEFYLSKRQSNNGNMIWERNFVEIGNLWGDMAACSDGGFILVGGENKANANIVVVKTDGNGNFK